MGDTGRARIVVLYDDWVAAMGIGSILQHAGYDVAVHPRVASRFPVVQRARPSVIVLECAEGMRETEYPILDQIAADPELATTPVVFHIPERAGIRAWSGSYRVIAKRLPIGNVVRAVRDLLAARCGG